MVFRFQEHFFNDGTGRQHAGDLSAYQFLGSSRIFDLLANGDFVAFLHQPRDISVYGMIRDAAHRDRRAAFVLITGGERNFEFAGGNDRVLIKHFVEIAQAEEDELAREASLHLMVLPHHGCEVFHHVGLSEGD